MASKKKKAVKKAAPKKAAPKKKAAVKKAVAKKTASKKTVAKKVVAKKATTKKTATKKTTVKSLAKATKSKATKKSATSKVQTQKATTSSVQTSAIVKKTSVDYSKAITPLADRLVVRVETKERITAGGLIIPETASQAEGFYRGVVLAAGHGKKNKKGLLRPLDVTKGDTVLFSQYAGTKVEFNGEELQIINESDVMGVVAE